MLLQLPVFRPSPETRLKFNEEYLNLGRIGFGNFSEVFCVKSKSDGNMYAVKKSKRRFLSKRDRAIWMKEVENFQRLGPSCEHIIEYYRAWQEEGYFFVRSVRARSARISIKSFSRVDTRISMKSFSHVETRISLNKKHSKLT